MSTSVPSFYLVIKSPHNHNRSSTSIFSHPPISSSSVPLNFLPSDCQAANLVSLSRLYPFFLLSSIAFCVTRSRISLCYVYKQLFSLFLFIILSINDRFSLAIVELSWQFYSTFICRIKTANIIWSICQWSIQSGVGVMIICTLIIWRKNKTSNISSYKINT